MKTSVDHCQLISNTQWNWNIPRYSNN